MHPGIGIGKNIVIIAVLSALNIAESGNLRGMGKMIGCKTAKNFINLNITVNQVMRKGPALAPVADGIFG